MFTLQAESLPFSKPETISLAKKLHGLELKYGSENFRARLEVAERAYATLLKQGFAKNLPASVELSGAGSRSSSGDFRRVA